MPPDHDRGILLRLSARRRLSSAGELGEGERTLQARWEYGSQFHWQSVEADGEQGRVPWASGSARLGCGRDALRALVGLVAPPRLWVPSYLCQELVTPLLGAGVEICCYPDSPLEPSLDLQSIALRPHDAVLLVNYFGLRSRSQVLPTSVPEVTLIEDHTHGPCSVWAHSSEGEYCFASLRKSLPLPDGAVLWSPQGRELPGLPPAGAHRKGAIEQRLSGMLIKSLYLRGHRVSKPSFRELLDDGEAQIGSGSISGITPLSSALVDIFPFETWRTARRDNFARLAGGLSGAGSFEVLQPADPQEAPFAAACVFPDAESCTAARASLVSHDVYPSRLWPLDEPAIDGVPSEHVLLAHRMFTLPCDGRYGAADVDRVLAIFARLGLV